MDKGKIDVLGRQPVPLQFTVIVGVSHTTGRHEQSQVFFATIFGRTL
jgi:hypothetical protein